MKTYKQKQKRRRARERASFPKLPDISLAKYGDRATREYILFDEKNKRYYGPGEIRLKGRMYDFRCCGNKKKADKFDSFLIKAILYNIGYTGAWRPIRIK